MPVHPSEEEAPAGITEKLAKDPSSMTDSTASEDPAHANEHDPLGGGDGKKVTASAEDFQSKGPQIPISAGDGEQQEMPPVEGSKEERRARMEELNR